MKLVIELNQDAERLFAEVLGTDDHGAIADDIHEILLAEFEWNSKYRKIWHELEDPEWFVYPVPDA
ncbi:MAG: hypothetical protein LYZ69_06105 [Nitrososphaerales archaeon]|nr:hypothetical protein [Nitrososphaerales archaeon]